MKAGINIFINTILITLFISCSEDDAIKSNISSVEPASGDIGSTITINGSNFSNDGGSIKVFFNDTEAEVISSSTEELTVKVPYTSDKQVTLTVINNGQSTDSPNKFVITSGTWTRISTNNPLTISGSSSLFYNINNKLYLHHSDGWLNGEPYPATFHEYNVSASSWDELTPLKEDLSVSSYDFQWTISGKGYYYSESDKTISVFNSQTKDWTTLTSNPYGSTIYRAFYIASTNTTYFIINNGDFISYNFNTDTWKEEISNGFNETMNYLGGYAGSDSFGFIATELGGVWKFDPTDNQWIKLPSFTGFYTDNINGGIFLTVNDVLYVGSSISDENSLWYFNTNDNAWYQKLSFPREGKESLFIPTESGFYWGFGIGENESYSKDLYLFEED
ncbi:IPT/TIG domain-containing protein [Fulvivirga ligni]|uniref:IPT/TIG domain-containing protein n=1 Tax=Fulvivirga ligni TaxID=2904246 RepID=UPI001F2F4EA9|nr:IPT/TIG domain-containing protein [Fulvivirga ligni]UII22011.1 IPT/TIG domain-containing protein [Fulvivirga ligni]